MEWTRYTGTWLACLGLLTCFWVVPVQAATEYVIGPEDVLDITFWQETTLNVQVRVGLDGKITIDIIGQIQAAGKTTEELQRDIVRDMSRLNRTISQAAVRVTQYNYNHVFVVGQVNTPGKKTFEEIPDLWTLINESGGVAPQGDLSRVTILRGGEDAGKIEVVNVSQAIATGNLDKLPKIRRQDTIEIPRTAGTVLAADLGSSTERRNQIYVIGAVNTPGPITYQENIDITEALALANGPTAEANLKKIQLVIKDGYYSQTVSFDLNKHSQTGKPARYIMQKEDMLIIPARRPGFLGEGIGGVAAAVGVITTAVLLWDQLRGTRTN
jgi:polysaccharide export outer membrane protein